MENLLQKYLEESFRKTEGGHTITCLPVVTISREYGCPSKLIGQMLAEAINRKHAGTRSPKWRFINKEIIEESARELKVSAVHVSSMLSAEEKGLVGDILTFSTTYGGSQRVRKTLRKVVRNFALQGYCVIIGRGGVAVTHDLPNALHIRLQAPVYWRASEVSAHHGIPEKEALKVIGETDLKRTKLIETLLGAKMELTDFDLVFNCQRLACEEIVQSVVSMMESRHMI
jgi:cytidylate kinase